MQTLGALTWAGGLQLSTPGRKRFGGLSGLDVGEDGVSFVSQSDGGDLYRGKLVLDRAGRLAGLAGVTVERLADEAGGPYRYKGEADSEDITLLPDGGLAVSFEQRHRVFRYPQGGGAAERLAISPDMERRPGNFGLEALAWKDGSLFEGAEDGEIWRCQPSPTGACRSVMTTSPFKGFRLTGLDAAGKGFVAVYRAVDILHGWRAVIAWLEPDAQGRLHAIRLADLSRPHTRDNMEGIAAIPLPGSGPAGAYRLYLVSDDNNRPGMERTLLMAFDWRGPANGR